MPSADNLATVEQDRSGSVVTAATRPCSSQDGILYTDVVVIGEWKFYCNTTDFNLFVQYQILLGNEIPSSNCAWL